MGAVKLHESARHAKPRRSTFSLLSGFSRRVDIRVSAVVVRFFMKKRSLCI